MNEVGYGDDRIAFDYEHDFNSSCWLSSDIRRAPNAKGKSSERRRNIDFKSLLNDWRKGSLPGAKCLFP
ncbi:hypothetical protein P5673_014081 [Acropora cervicornis]|uniref:Uncharacterized protein n=1 Tax=Acropora cervicornis TaxID=6130 RepID=A0AAD9V5X9_ACRCE|nr:hypothetical protein P5673_014081 [Acropora cervicornis]